MVPAWWRANAIVAVVAVAAVAATGAPDNGFGDQYEWVRFNDAADLAASSGKPIMLVAHKSYCGACKALKPLFAAHAGVLELSRQFVMVNSDEDLGPDTAPDGGYIPRILFLSPQGRVMTEVTNPDGNPKYKYYHHNPDTIARSMRTALELVASEGADNSEL